jgi:AraC family transcriptional regulator
MGSNHEGVQVMTDSARENYGTAFEPSSYTMRQSVVPLDVERSGSPETENHAAPAARSLHHPTATRAADKVVQVFPIDAVSRTTASWPGMAVEIVQANRRGRIDYHYSAPVHMLVLHERGLRHDGCTVIEGLSKSTLQDCSRKLVFVPAGHKYHDWHEPRTLSRMVFFYFDPARLALGPELGSSSYSLAPRLFFEDGPLVDTALKLASLIESGSSAHRAYAEALGVVLAHELVRINTARQRAEAPVSGGLAGWQRRKAVAYIEEHLAEPISLAALADLVGLSTCYFCRAFRQSCGVPPQRYQLRQRVERAKSLLAKHAASVTDVGLAVGYSDTSAFCTAFRRITGLTPSAYRRGLS